MVAAQPMQRQLCFHVNVWCGNEAPKAGEAVSAAATAQYCLLVSTSWLCVKSSALAESTGRGVQPDIAG